MAIIGNLLKKGIRLREMMEQEYTAPFDLQKKELKEYKTKVFSPLGYLLSS